MKLFDQHFVFSHNEKLGILGFLIIVLAMTISYWIIPQYYYPKATDFTQALATMKQADTVVIAEVAKFEFNPNTITKDSLELLGFSSKQAWNLLNFRKKVKPFETKNELKKLYAMTDSLYQEILPFIDLPSIKENNSKDVKGKWDEKVKVERFAFNPNTISQDSLQLLGFSQKAAATFVNFRNKTEGFETKADLQKVYGVTPKLFAELEPFIVFKEKTPSEVSKEMPMVNLNLATKEELMKAKGIGPAFSGRIIEFREKTGGFVEVSQLTEIYGIDQDWVEEYGSQFEAFVDELTQININTIEFKALLRHPYFSYSQTQLILNYREQHGDFKSVEEIWENNLIKPKHYRKIAPYLTTE